MPTSCRCCPATTASSRPSARSSRDSAASISSTSCSPRRKATRSASTTTRLRRGWSACAAHRRSRASMRASSIAAAISAGSPTASCWCCAIGVLDAALHRLTAGGDRGRRRRPPRVAHDAVVRHGGSRAPGSGGAARPVARRAGRRAGGLQHGHQRRRLRDRRRPRPAGDGAAEASALRRRSSRARSTPDCARSGGPWPRRPPSRPDTADEEPRPPLRVEFAGGHRIAVETEAVVKRESILNTVGSLVRDPAAAVHRVPQRCGWSPSGRCRRCCRWSWCSARSASPAPACRPPPPARRRCCSASASTASCCSTSRHRWRWPSDPDDRRAGGDRRAVEQHAARHVDDGGDVLRPDVRRLPEPAAARPADRAQHGGLRRPHAGAGAGAPAAPPAAARRRRAADAAARRLDRAAPRGGCSRASVVPDRASWASPRRASASTRRSTGCDR